LKKSSGRVGEDSKPYLVIFIVIDANDDIGHSCDCCFKY
jgi:hypothetical protein